MTPRSSNRAREIEAWFYDHQDGEFVVLPSAHPSSIEGHPTTSRTVLYTTKGHCLAHKLRPLGVAHPVTIVARYGMPGPNDLLHFDGLPVGATCCFLGDADPLDILAFAWLREHCAIGWLGVNDEFLSRIATQDQAPPEIPMSEAEKQAMHALADLCPDYRDLVGPRCSATLDRGFKIELEAAIINLNAGTGG